MKFAADVTTNGDGVYLLNLNSIWDPLRVGGGNPPQPYGRDQLALLYNRYRVISCGWRLHTLNDAAGAGVQFACVPSNDGLPAPGAAGLSVFRAMPRCKYVVQHSTGDPKIISGKVYIPSLVGRNKTEYMSDDRYQAQIDSSPAELALLTIGAANNTGAMITTGRVFNVLLEYTIEFFDIKMQLPS